MMRWIMREKFSGRLCLFSPSCEEEAVSRANNTPFGLGAGIMTKDINRAHRLPMLEANIWINSYNLIPPGLPFGGIKQSGFGREGSAYALEAYTEIKAVYIQL